MKLVYSLLAALAISTPTFAYQDTGSSSVQVTQNDDGTTTVTTTNLNYDIGYLWGEEELETLVLKKSVSEIRLIESDGSQAQLSVEARSLKNPKEILWSINEDAHDGLATSDDLYLTWLSGCCDVADGYRAYNLKTGKLIVTYDSNMGTSEGYRTAPFIIDVPNARPQLKRIVGITSSDASRDFDSAQMSDGKSKLASITYADYDGALQTVEVYGLIPEGWGVGTTSEIVDLVGSNEIRNNTMTLWSSDGKSNATEALEGFAFKLTFSTESAAEVIIPVKGDRLDVKSATVPAGYVLIQK